MKRMIKVKVSLLEDIFRPIYFNFVYYLNRNKLIFLSLLLLEIIPIFIIIDEVIFRKSTNHIFSLFYFLSSGSWIRILNNKIGTELIFPNKFILQKNSIFKKLSNDLNFKNKENIEIKDLIEYFFRKEKNLIYTPCINYMLEKNGTTNYLDYATSIFSSNYKIYYHEKSITLVIILSIFLSTILLFCLLKFSHKIKITYNISANMINLIIRTLFFGFVLLSMEKIFEYFFLSIYNEMNYYGSEKNLTPFISVFSVISISIILIIFITFSLVFVRRFTCYDIDYPYDFKSVIYDNLMIILKITGAFLYNIQKLSCIFGQLNLIFEYSCIIFILIIFLFGIYFSLNYKYLVKFSYFNKFRCLFIFVLNLYLIYKLFEEYFNLFDIVLNFILFFFCIFICITVYFYIDNKLKTNFYHSEISLI